MKSRLRALVARPVAGVADAEIAVEAGGLLRDLLRLEEWAEALLARVEGGEAPRAAAERPAEYETGGYEGLTLHEAARRALAAAGVPLHVRDLGGRIKAGGWRHPRSAAPRPDQIEFQLAARLPRHDRTFRRVAPNTFGLAEWGDALPARRPKPRLEPVRGRGPRLAKRIADEPDLAFGEQPRWRSS